MPDAAANPTPDSSESMVDWLRTNGTKFVMVVAVVGATAALGLLWRATVEKKETNASRTLADAERVVESGNAALAQSDLQTLLRRYDGTKAAIQARILLARVLFNQQKLDDGIRELRAVTSPGPFASSLYGLLGAGLEQSGKPGEAAAEYLKAAEAAPSKPERATHLADAARAYEAANDVEHARQIWTEMARDDSSPMSGEARVRLGTLSAKPIS